MTDNPELLRFEAGVYPLIPATAPPLSRSPAHVYLATLGSVESRRTMAGSIAVLADLLTGCRDPLLVPWWRLRYAHTVAVRAALMGRYSAATCNKHLSALRGVLRSAWRLELMTAEEYQRAVDLPGVKGNRLPAGRKVGAGELRALFDGCRGDQLPAGPRDGAILALLFGAGLRRSEVARLLVADVEEVADPRTFRVLGKRNAERLAFLESAGGVAAMSAWLAVRGGEPGPLFVRIRKNGRIVRPVEGLGASAIRDVCRRRAERAGVRPFSPHDLRRTFISAGLAAGADLSTMQRLAGHRSVATTTRYDRRGDVAQRDAAALIFIPWGETDGI